MEHLVRCLCFILIPVIVSGVLALLRRPKEAEKGKVHYPKFFLLLGLVCTTLFLIPTFITAFTDEPLWLPIGFFAFSLLGACFIVAYINCRISFNEEGFVSKNFFGAKRVFTYDEVTYIKEDMHDTCLYMGKRKVMVDEFAVGGREFVAFVKKQYRSQHDGRAIPKVEKSTRDIFRGNVTDVPGFLAAYILVGLIIVGLAVFLAWYTFTPTTAEDTVAQEVTFLSLRREEDAIVLISKDRQIYQLRFYDDALDIEALKAICDGNTVVTTYSKEITSKNEKPYYSVHAMKLGEAYLLSFEETNRWHRQEYWPLLLFPAVFAVVWGGYIVGSVIVGRNPKKYGPKIVNFFFKEGYVRY